MQKKARFDNICPHCELRPRVKHPNSQSRYCGPCKNELNMRMRRKNPEAYAVIHTRAKLKHQFGISTETFEAMVSAQNNLCAICKQPEQQKRRLSVDHDHQTDAIRGLLCMNCNAGIGNLRDSIELLESAAEYLRSYKLLQEAMSGLGPPIPDNTPPPVV